MTDGATSGEDVTATLRERIAKAVTSAAADGRTVDDPYKAADAVLADLGLTLVECRICGCVGGGPCEGGFDHEYLYSLSPSESDTEQRGEDVTRVPCGTLPEPFYRDDFATIYHGDCREIDAWDLAGAVMVTDPPYGVAYRSGWANDFQDVTIANDESTTARDEVLARWSPRPALVFGSWKQPRPPGTRAVLTWDKGTVGMGDLSVPWFPCTEEIYVLSTGWVGSRTSGVLRYVGRNEHHPTEKPDGLMRALIAKCPPLAEVVDPFMGSGSTLRAAKDLGRKCIGIEIEERYCEIAAKRLAQEVLDLGGMA